MTDRVAPASGGGGPAAAAIAVLLMVGGGSAGAAAQSCGLVPHGVAAGVTGGIAAYEAAGGLRGTVVGVRAGAGTDRGSFHGSYRRIRLDREDPQMGRLAGTVPLPVPLGAVTLCAVGHGGVSRLTVSGEANTVLAAGVGLRLARPLAVSGVTAVPYGELRALGARSGGRLLGVEMEARGLALGGEAGVRAVYGPITVMATASLDGFAPGLGLTPYPSRAAELGIGVRF